MKLLNTAENFEMLQPFATIDQENANIIAIREQYSDVLTPATKQVLDVIHRYASKFFGVCYLAKTTIAKMLGVSRRTVIRACQQLESLGIIVQYETKRHKGDKRRSSNAIVFLTQISAREAFVEESVTVSDNLHNQSDNTSRQKSDVTPNVTTECHSVDALSEALSGHSVSKEIKTSTQAYSVGKPTTLYDALKSVFKPTKQSFAEFKAITRVAFGMIRNARKSTKLPMHQLESIVYHALCVLVRKRGVENKCAMFSAIIRNKINDVLTPVVRPSYGNAAPRVERKPDWFDAPKTSVESVKSEDKVEMDSKYITLMKSLYGEDWTPKKDALVGV